MSERRVLVVSYHFGAGCPTGGFRWNATAAHLCSHGWDVDVVTSARPGLRPDPLPSGPGALDIVPVEPVRFPTRLKGRLLGAGRRLRGLLSRREALPAATAGPDEAPVDPAALFVWQPGYRRSPRERVLHALDYVERASAELAWSWRALTAARRLLAERRYRAVVVSSPPHLTHEVGVRLARESGLPYIADYRDPWTLGMGPHLGYVNDLERIVGRRFELRSLRSAHTVVHNTERARLAVAEECAVPGRHLAIPNGYDATVPVRAPDAACFRVVYTGHLYPFMDVRPLFAACARLRDRHRLDPSSLRIDFVGTQERFEDVLLSDLARAYALRDSFTRHPRLPRQEAAAFQEAAALLVAYDWLFPIAVVSKFYEYARMKGTMLLFGNPDGALADAAAKLGLRVLDASDEKGADEVVEQAYQRWRSGSFERPADATGLFERGRQSARIRQLLEDFSCRP